METLTVPVGTLIHIGGMPFLLAAEASVHGRQQNLDDALMIREIEGRIQAMGGEGQTQARKTIGEG